MTASLEYLVVGLPENNFSGEIVSLHAHGVLTDSEFEAEKAKTLAS